MPYNFLPRQNLLGGFDGSFMNNMMAGGYLPSPGIFLIVLGLAFLIFWIWMLVDMVQRPVKNKTMWAIILIFSHIIGALVYFFTGRKSVAMLNAQNSHHENHQSVESKNHNANHHQN